MDWLWAIAGLVVGVGGTYVIGVRRWGMAEMLARMAEQRCADLGAAMEGEKRASDALRQEASEARERSAELAAELRATQQNLLEQKRMQEEAQVKLRDAFAAVSAEALAKNNEAFLSLARERFGRLATEAAGTLDERKAQIDAMLKPMQEVMGQYQLRLGEIEKSRVESYSMLREQLGTLAEVQRTLGAQTTQLVSALRRPNARGQWGEMTLRRLVELSGMANRCDFYEQETATDDVGQRSRPDMLIRLPGSREVIVDCKAALDAFLDAASAGNEDARRAHLVRHSQQVRARARELCAKSYWTQFRNAPEYVVMFLPGESFFSAAVEADHSLYEDCLRSHVIVATPTTLLALLKTIARIWQQEDLTQNAEKVRLLGMELYERVAILAGHFDSLGTSIGKTVTIYNSVLASLESRVVVTARKMAELGAKTDKTLVEAAPIDLQTRSVSAGFRAADLDQIPGGH